MTILTQAEAALLMTLIVAAVLAPVVIAAVRLAHAWWRLRGR